MKNGGGRFTLRRYINGEGMKRLYYKNEAAFALLSILVYAAVCGAAGGSVYAALTARALYAAALCAFLVRGGAAEYCGLCGIKEPGAATAQYIAAALLVSSPLWFGVHPGGTAEMCAMNALLMLTAAFAEELLFRGLLLHALLKESERTAMAVSSLCFGLVHLMNLFGGADVIGALSQSVCAAAAGLLFAKMTLCSGSLLPCVLTHGAMNVLSLFESSALADEYRLPRAAALVVIALAGSLLPGRGGKSAEKD